MFYKLSNQTQQKNIEKVFDAKYKYGHIFSPRIVIDGLQESTISIITSSQPHIIQPSIWGILPKSFSEDWQVYQNQMNTLNTTDKSIDSNDWYSAPFLLGRCLILVTGYYTNLIVDDQLLPFHIGSKDGRPFSIAGIYNKLMDGFLTTSLITVESNKQHQQIHNISNQMPLIIPKKMRNTWLDCNLSVPEIRTFLNSTLHTDFRATPISKQIFDNSLLEDSKKIHLADDELPLPLSLQLLLADYNIKILETD